MYSDVPLYNIQAVASATGVPSITLRSWERRYGVPDPKRDVKGYRLYSERDIAVTRWLHERVQQGVGISRAVNMLQLLGHVGARVEPAPTFMPEEMRARLLTAVMQSDAVAMGQVLAEALAVGSVEDMALSIVQPVLHSIGEEWSQGRLSVTTEHIASNQLRAHLAQLIQISPPPLRSERLVIGCAPGEMHEMGALMLSLFLRRRGFDVLYAGANVESSSLFDDAIRMQPEAVLLSAMTVDSAKSLTALFETLQTRYAGILAFGGQAYNYHPDLVDGTPGSFLGSDAREAVHTLEDMLPSRAA